MKIPAYLEKGDTLAIISPAKAIDEKFILFAKQFWEEKGFRVIVTENALSQHHYFSGTDTERSNDLQKVIDHPDIKAIICARGGYGCVRTLDYVQWAGMVNFPKWLIGFSDVTVYHQLLGKLEVASIHATMPLNYKDNTSESLESLHGILIGQNIHYQWKTAKQNKQGACEGLLLGGNLAVLSNLIGTDIFPDYTGKILFLEEVGEYLYAIDRMFYQLKRAGVLDKISGLIIGSFSNLKDTETPFGNSLEEIILNHFKFSSIPVCFDFPAGHQDDNRALLFGKKMKLSVNENTASLEFSH